MRCLLVLALVMLPQSGWALSCLPHSVEAAYVQAAEAEAEYVIVQGSLSFDARKLPKVDWEKQGDTPPLTMIPAVLHGKSLSKAGFVLPFEQNVTLAVACFGPWCAQVPHETDVLAFVERGSDGYVIATDPCGGFLFPDPTPAVVKSVKACFAGQTCTPLKR